MTADGAPRPMPPLKCFVCGEENLPDRTAMVELVQNQPKAFCAKCGNEFRWPPKQGSK